MDLPSGVDVSMGGVTKDIEESFKQLGLAMLAAIAIVYFVLVVTFGGALAPFAIYSRYHLQSLELLLPY